MKSLCGKISVLLITAVMAGLFISGCQEQTAGMTNSKQARLAVIENVQLTELLEKSEAEYKEQRAKLAECQKEKEKIVLRMEEGTKEMISFMMTQNKKLMAENKKLKEQLSQHND